MYSTIRIPASMFALSVIGHTTLAEVPGISGLEGVADIRLAIDAFDNGMDANDAAEANLNFDPGNISLPEGLFWSDTSAAEIDLGPTAGRIDSDASLTASDQSFVYRQSVSGAASVGDNGQFSADYKSTGNFFAAFHAPTLVDIVIRLDVQSPTPASSVFAGVIVSGIDNQPPLQLTFDNGDPTGLRELTFRTTIDSIRPVVFDFVTDFRLTPDQGFPAELGGIELFGSITVVPTTGTGALLALGGLLTARRRRR